MIFLLFVILMGILMCLVCFYIIVCLFINCLNEIKWEIFSEVCKVFFDFCSLLYFVGSRFDLWFILLYRVIIVGCGDIKRCLFVNFDVDL